jgi:hypothetical protein
MEEGLRVLEAVSEEMSLLLRAARGLIVFYELETGGGVL